MACVESREYKGCHDYKNCVFQSVWSQVNMAISDIVDHVTFEDLARKLGDMKQAKSSAYKSQAEPRTTG